MSAHLSFQMNNSAPLGHIFVTIDTEVFFEYLKKIQFSLKSDKNNGYFV